MGDGNYELPAEWLRRRTGPNGRGCHPTFDGGDEEDYERVRARDWTITPAWPPESFLPLAPPTPSTAADRDWYTLGEAAAVVGLTPRSLANRIHASGGRKVWVQCGRLPGKAPTFEKAKFTAWWKSGANLSPARTRQARKARRRPH
jgi:hypothetical protein